MRKLLVLMLVLGTASLASADLIIKVFQSDGVTPYVTGTALSANATLKLSINAINSNQGDVENLVLLGDTAKATMSYSLLAVNTVGAAAPSASAALDTPANQGVGNIGTQDGFFGTIGAYPSTQTVPYVNGEYFKNITLTYLGHGPVMLGLYSVNGTDFSIDAQLGGVLLNSITVGAVPEPATLAILGLGGLLLRRKK